MLNFPVNKSVNFNYGYGNYSPIKKENKEPHLKQITDNDYRNYSNAISTMNKPIVSFGANNYTTKLDPKNAELREKIFQIDGWCFEKLAGYIFENAQNKNGEKMFCNVEVTRASGDGGVDILLETNPALILDGKNKRTLVQCKHYQGHCVDIETMQNLADCREKEIFQGKYKKEDINCLMIASSGVNNNVLTDYLPTIKDFDYKLMNLDNLIDFAKKHNVRIDDEVLNQLIEETKERSQCRQDLLSQKDRIKEMINDESMTIAEVIETLNSEFKAKYPHLVKGNYISNFIKFTFNPPDCFQLLKKEGYKFEENLGNKNQNIFSVKKGNETFVVYYSTKNSANNIFLESAKDSINKAKTDKDDKTILISTGGFQEGKKTSDSLKNFDKVYTVVDNKLQEYNGVSEKLRPVVDLLKQEGYSFEENLGNKKQNIFSVKKGNKTFVVYYSTTNSANNILLESAKDSINKAKTDKDDKTILISTGGFKEGKKTSDSLKNFDKVYTVVDNELQEYNGVPEKLRPVVDLLTQEGYEFEDNLSRTSSQNIFSVTKNNETFVVYYSTKNSADNIFLESAKDSINKAKTDKDDKTILISTGGFQKSKKTSDSLKNFDKVYTVVDNKLQEYNGVPEKLRPVVDLLTQEGYEFVDNLSRIGGQNIFSVTKNNETFVVYYSTRNSADNIFLGSAKDSINRAKTDKDDKTILISTGGFSEVKKTSDSLKNFDKVYTVVDNKLQEYNGVPEKLRPVVDLLTQEGYEFEENLSNLKQNIFSVKKNDKTFIVSCCAQNGVLYPMATNKLLKSIDNTNKNKDGIILVTKNGISENGKKGFEEKTIQDENGNQYIVYTKDLTQEQKAHAV